VTFSLRPAYHDPRTAELVERLRDYLDDELADYERERGITPASRLTRADLEPVWSRSRELGLYGIHLPEEYGEQNLSYTQLAALKEEIGASGRVLSHSVLGDMGGPLRAGDILKHATRHQLDTSLLPLLRGERACCFSLTETDAGSDVRSMRTVAIPDGDGYRLSGTRCSLRQARSPTSQRRLALGADGYTAPTLARFAMHLDPMVFRFTASGPSAESAFTNHAAKDRTLPVDPFARRADLTKVGRVTAGVARGLPSPPPLAQGERHHRPVRRPVRHRGRGRRHQGLPAGAVGAPAAQDAARR
jgi:hypothetical protein